MSTWSHGQSELSRTMIHGFACDLVTFTFTFNPITPSRKARRQILAKWLRFSQNFKSSEFLFVSKATQTPSFPMLLLLLSSSSSSLLLLLLFFFFGELYFSYLLKMLDLWVHVLMRVTGRVGWLFQMCVCPPDCRLKYSVFYVYLCSCIRLCVILLVSFMQS